MKKILSVLCAAALIVCAFSGCSRNSAESAGFTLSFTYDSHYTDYGDDVVEVYEQLCRAVMDGETSVTVNNQHYDAASRLFYVSFPLSRLVNSINMNSDGSLRISYTQTTSQHLKLVEEFTDEVYSVLNECGYPEVTGNELLLNIYSYVAQNVTLDLDYSTAYDAFVQGLGSSSSYESMFRYLVQQAGFSASRVYGIAFDGTHFLTEVVLDGELYYFDPCAENSYSGGEGLSYFGLGVIGLQQMGLGADVSYSDDTVIPFSPDSGRFDALFQTVSYTYADGIITATKSGGDIVEVALISA